MITMDSNGKEYEMHSGKSERQSRYINLDRLGFVLVIIGFLLQIVAKWMPE
jgi:hypothetical protein